MVLYTFAEHVGSKNMLRVFPKFGEICVLKFVVGLTGTVGILQLCLHCGIEVGIDHAPADGIHSTVREVNIKCIQISFRDVVPVNGAGGTGVDIQIEGVELPVCAGEGGDADGVRAAGLGVPAQQILGHGQQGGMLAGGHIDLFEVGSAAEGGKLAVCGEQGVVHNILHRGFGKGGIRSQLFNNKTVIWEDSAISDVVVTLGDEPGSRGMEGEILFQAVFKGGDLPGLHQILCGFGGGGARWELR